MRYLAAPTLALMALVPLSAVAQTAITPRTLAALPPPEYDRPYTDGKLIEIRVDKELTRLIAPGERTAFREMLQHELRGRRELPGHEMRRVAEQTWRNFCKHGWPRI
jgi:hypothetical protein